MKKLTFFLFLLIFSTLSRHSSAHYVAPRISGGLLAQNGFYRDAEGVRQSLLERGEEFDGKAQVAFANNVKLLLRRLIGINRYVLLMDTTGIKTFRASLVI